MLNLVPLAFFIKSFFEKIFKKSNAKKIVYSIKFTFELTIKIFVVNYNLLDKLKGDDINDNGGVTFNGQKIT